MSRFGLGALLRRAALPLGLLAARGLGIWIGGIGDSSPPDAHDHGTDAAKPTIWTCSMHPQIRMPRPGQCPICHMDLIPADDGPATDEGPRELVLSERAKALARVETAEVTQRPVSRQVRLFGKVAYDETRLATIAAWVNGRIERMYVDYTGVVVRKGDHLVQIYSPELLSTQLEMLTAVRAAGRYAASDDGPVARSVRALAQATKERLRLWGLTGAQIDRIAQRGRPEERVTIYAPIGGIVVEKNGQEGMYVQTGTRIYAIADLSTVWVQFEAFETDLPWLRYGQPVQIRLASLPGETFAGIISFLDPLVDEKKRTARVRVILPNPTGRLKPGMYTRAVVDSALDEQGRVLAPDLAGKWIGPMHPEVIRDRPGNCPVCGMKLVRAEELGLAGQTAPGATPLVIPASAPLITGKRAVVYVEQPERDRPTYEGREVELGPRAGDDYVVLSGLRAGERVVVQGNFQLDSAMQLKAKPSMMSPTGGGGTPAHRHGGPADRPAKGAGAAKPEASITRLAAPPAFLDALAGLADAYLGLQQALAADDEAEARRAAKALPAALDGIDMGLLAPQAHQRWMELLPALRKAVTASGQAADLAALRQALSPLSNVLLEGLQSFGAPEGKTYYRHHCPMAFDNRGAWWLQADEQVANPYFGESMLRCADVSEKIPAAGK